MNQSSSDLDEQEMGEFNKILVLENEIEAQLLDSILNERNIPHFIKSYRDTAYDGLFQAHKGWGHIEAPIRFREEIRAIYQDLPLKNQESIEPPPGNAP